MCVVGQQAAGAATATVVVYGAVAAAGVTCAGAMAGATARAVVTPQVVQHFLALTFVLQHVLALGDAQVWQVC